VTKIAEEEDILMYDRWGEAVEAVLRRGSAATRLLRLWVRIPSGTGLCDGSIPHLVVCVSECDQVQQ
jgi:hypothetical protein